MVIDFRFQNANTNLQRLFVEIINQQIWFHRCFLKLKSKKLSFTDVVKG